MKYHIYEDYIYQKPMGKEVYKQFVVIATPSNDTKRMSAFFGAHICSFSSEEEATNVCKEWNDLYNKAREIYFEFIGHICTADTLIRKAIKDYVATVEKK